MTLDEELVKTVDRVVKRLHTTRSAFTRDALREAVQSVRNRELEERHRIGYTKKPVTDDEFDGWETEQKWGDE